MQFRLSRSLKEETLGFLRRIFILHERGSLFLTNGVYHIAFSQRPEVQTVEAFEKPGSGNEQDPGTRQYPVVLIGDIGGELLPGGIGGANRNLGDFISMTDTDPDGNVVLGGEAKFSLTVICQALTRIECENLADVVGIYLAHPVFKDYLFNKAGFALEGAPSFASEGSVEDVASDYKIYQTALSLRLSGWWRETVDKLEPLSEIILHMVVDP